MGLPSTSARNNHTDIGSAARIDGRLSACARLAQTEGRNAPRLRVTNTAGFTLIEVIISIGLLAMIAALGLFISMNFYRSYAFRSERSTIVSVLQKARSSSLDNIDDQRHGVHFFLDPANSNKLTYLIFECASNCTSYPGSSPADNAVTASYNIALTSPAMPFDVIFEQLTGSCITSTGTNVFKCDPGTQPISILDSGKTYNITANSQGRIDW